MKDDGKFDVDSEALVIDDIQFDAAPRGAAEPVFGDTCGFIAIVVIAFA